MLGCSQDFQKGGHTDVCTYVGLSGDVVAAWLAEYCIQFLAVHICKLGDIEFPREKVLRLVEQQVG